MKSTLFLVFLLAIGTVKSEKGCGLPADIVFVLDESGSIHGPDFTEQLNFVQSTIDSFEIGPTKVQVGVEAFGDYSRIIFPLGKYSVEQELKNEVKAIKQARGNTRTDKALKLAREEMFSEGYVRPGVRHLAIVITDGDSDYPDLTQKEARLCHAEGIEVFAIGVGRSVSRRELEAIASSSDLVFEVKDYTALDTIREKLAWTACGTPSTPIPPTTTKEPAIQGCVGDVLDHIWSISEQAGVEDTDLALGFIEKVTAVMKIGPDQVQVGLAPKVCDEGNGIRLKDHDTREGFRRDLDKRRLGGLHTDRTLQYIRQQGFSSSNGARSDAVRYGILIVDNQSQDWEETLREAEEAKKQNIKLIVIGVGSKAERNQLQELAFSPKDYFFVENYGKLADLEAKVILRLCEGISGSNSARRLRTLLLRDYFERFY